MREPRMTGSGRTPCENETEGVDWFLCERSGLAPIVVRLRAPCIGSLVHESSLHRIVGAPPCIGSLVRAPCIGSLVHESIVTAQPFISATIAETSVSLVSKSVLALPPCSAVSPLHCHVAAPPGPAAERGLSTPMGLAIPTGLCPAIPIARRAQRCTL